MSAPLRLFIVAGEPSGDRLGADLISRLRAHTQLEVSGVGGEAMAGQGLSSLFPMADLAVMGLVDVLARLPHLLRRVRETADAIARAAPDVAVLIDSQEFSTRVAERLRRRGYAGTLLLYVAPAVWAHGAGRARRLRPLFDEVLAVLPFEPKVMARLEGPRTSYVGHPSLADSPAVARRDTILIMPGSRRGELSRHLPGFRHATEALARAVPGHRFVLPTLPHLVGPLTAEVAEWPVGVELDTDLGRREQLFARAEMALVASGTATLELGMAGVPMVIAYQLDPVQAFVLAQKGRPPVGLPNIVLGECIVPELVDRRLSPAGLATAALDLASNPDARAAQRAAFARLRTKMELGDPEWPRQHPEFRVLAHWQARLSPS